MVFKDRREAGEELVQAGGLYPFFLPFAVASFYQNWEEIRNC